MLFVILFFFNDTATTEIYTLSLHDALPISACVRRYIPQLRQTRRDPEGRRHQSSAMAYRHAAAVRSEEHTSELQSQSNLVCRLLLEKKKSRARMHHGPG